MLNKSKVFLIFSLMVSCSPYKNTSYRVLNRNGKVVYFEDKRTPIYNNQMKENGMQDAVNISKKAKETAGKPTIRTGNISEDLVLDSSAYTLSSVVDNLVRDEDMNQVAKDVNNKASKKTIKDFDNIPDSYFTSTTKKNTKTFVAENNKNNTNYKLSTDNKTTKASNTETSNTKTDNKLVENKTTTKTTYKKGQAIFSKSNTKTSNNKTSNNKTSNNVSTRTYNSSSLNNPNLEKNKYYIQVGSFRDYKSANDLINKFKDVGKEREVVKSKVKGKDVYRSTIGVFNTKAEADKEMEKILNKGHFDCYVFKN